MPEVKNAKELRENPDDIEGNPEIDRDHDESNPANRPAEPTFGEVPDPPLGIGDDRARQMAELQASPVAVTGVKYAARNPESAFEKKVLSAFVKVTGYKDKDVMGLNGRTLTVTTFNGGKYQLNRKGNQVRHLSGPTPPKAEAVGV